MPSEAELRKQIINEIEEEMRDEGDLGSADPALVESELKQRLKNLAASQPEIPSEVPTGIPPEASLSPIEEPDLIPVKEPDLIPVEEPEEPEIVTELPSIPEPIGVLLPEDEDDEPQTIEQILELAPPSITPEPEPEVTVIPVEVVEEEEPQTIEQVLELAPPTVPTPSVPVPIEGTTEPPIVIPEEIIEEEEEGEQLTPEQLLTLTPPAESPIVIPEEKLDEEAMEKVVEKIIKEVVPIEEDRLITVGPLNEQISEVQFNALSSELQKILQERGIQGLNDELELRRTFATEIETKGGLAEFLKDFLRPEATVGIEFGRNKALKAGFTTEQLKQAEDFLAADQTFQLQVTAQQRIISQGGLLAFLDIVDDDTKRPERLEAQRNLAREAGFSEEQIEEVLGQLRTRDESAVTQVTRQTAIARIEEEGGLLALLEEGEDDRVVTELALQAGFTIEQITSLRKQVKEFGLAQVKIDEAEKRRKALTELNGYFDPESQGFFLGVALLDPDITIEVLREAGFSEAAMITAQHDAGRIQASQISDQARQQAVDEIGGIASSAIVGNGINLIVALQAGVSQEQLLIAGVDPNELQEALSKTSILSRLAAENLSVLDADGRTRFNLADALLSGVVTREELIVAGFLEKEIDEAETSNQDRIESAQAGFFEGQLTIPEALATTLQEEVARLVVERQEAQETVTRIESEFAALTPDLQKIAPRARLLTAQQKVTNLQSDIVTINFFLTGGGLIPDQRVQNLFSKRFQLQEQLARTQAELAQVETLGLEEKDIVRGIIEGKIVLLEEDLKENLERLKEATKKAQTDPILSLESRRDAIANAIRVIGRTPGAELVTTVGVGVAELVAVNIAANLALRFLIKTSLKGLKTIPIAASKLKATVNAVAKSRQEMAELQKLVTATGRPLTRTEVEVVINNIEKEFKFRKFVQEVNKGFSGGAPGARGVTVLERTDPALLENLLSQVNTAADAARVGELFVQIEALGVVRQAQFISEITQAVSIGSTVGINTAIRKARLTGFEIDTQTFETALSQQVIAAISTLPTFMDQTSILAPPVSELSEAIAPIEEILELPEDVEDLEIVIAPKETLEEPEDILISIPEFPPAIIAVPTQPTVAPTTGLPTPIETPIEVTIQPPIPTIVEGEGRAIPVESTPIQPVDISPTIAPPVPEIEPSPDELFPDPFPPDLEPITPSSPDPFEEEFPELFPPAEDPIELPIEVTTPEPILEPSPKIVETPEEPVPIETTPKPIPGPTPILPEISPVEPEIPIEVSPVEPTTPSEVPTPIPTEEPGVLDIPEELEISETIIFPEEPEGILELTEESSLAGGEGPPSTITPTIGESELIPGPEISPIEAIVGPPLEEISPIIAPADLPSPVIDPTPLLDPIPDIAPSSLPDFLPDLSPLPDLDLLPAPTPTPTPVTIPNSLPTTISVPDLNLEIKSQPLLKETSTEQPFPEPKPQLVAQSIPQPLQSTTTPIEKGKGRKAVPVLLPSDKKEEIKEKVKLRTELRKISTEQGTAYQIITKTIRDKAEVIRIRDSFLPKYSPDTRPGTAPVPPTLGQATELGPRILATVGRTETTPTPIGLTIGKTPTVRLGTLAIQQVSSTEFQIQWGSDSFLWEPPSA